MLDDSIFTAFIEIKKVLKKKYPNNIERLFYLAFITTIIVTPLFLFDYWLGRISGIILAGLMFFTIVSNAKNESKISG